MNRKWILFLIISFFSSHAFAENRLTKIRLALNWVPEPEFGGLYTAKIEGLYKKAGLDVDIIAGGAGSPTVQMLAAGQVEAVVTSANEILIARTTGADVVAVYNIYETSPLCIMTHRSRGAKTLADVLSAGTLAIERGQTFYDFIEKKIGFSKVKVVPYTGGIAQFLRDPNFSQQGFVFSEPLLAKRQGADPQTFLLADIGYNPMIAVVAVKGSMIQKDEPTVKKLVGAIREGWIRYQKDPKPTNKFMAALNKAMDLQTFDEGAEAQRKLVQKDEKIQLGTMTEARWQESAKQLVEFRVLKNLPEIKGAFKNY